MTTFLVMAALNLVLIGAGCWLIRLFLQRIAVLVDLALIEAKERRSYLDAATKKMGKEIELMPQTLAIQQRQTIDREIMDNEENYQFSGNRRAKTDENT